MNTSLSQHALARVRQRGLRESDIPAIMAAGTDVTEDGVYLLDQDVDREIRKHKQEIAMLERLRGCRVVVAGETVVTVYRPSRKTEKRLLRGAHRRENCPKSCPDYTKFYGDYAHAS